MGMRKLASSIRKSGDHRMWSAEFFLPSKFPSERPIGGQPPSSEGLFFTSPQNKAIGSFLFSTASAIARAYGKTEIKENPHGKR